MLYTMRVILYNSFHLLQGGNFPRSLSRPFNETEHMIKGHRASYGLGIWMALVPAMALAKSPASPAPQNPVMPSLIEQFTADSRSLEGAYPLEISHAGIARFERFD